MVRGYEPDDVDAVHEAIGTHARELRRWLPWFSREPVDRAQRAEQLRNFRGRMDLGLDFFYGVFDLDDTLLGGAGLHPRSVEGVLEIGYWLTPPSWGQGLATEAAAALTRVGFEVMGATRMEIRVAPHNARSLRIPEKLGYHCEGQLRGVARATDGAAIDLVVFGMLASELPGTLAAALPLELSFFV